MGPELRGAWRRTRESEGGGRGMLGGTCGGEEGGDNIHPLRRFSAHSLGCGKLNVALHNYKGTHTYVCSSHHFLNIHLSLPLMYSGHTNTTSLNDLLIVRSLSGSARGLSSMNGGVSTGICVPHVPLSPLPRSPTCCSVWESRGQMGRVRL